MSMSDETRQQKLVKAWQTGADLTLMALDLFWPEHIRERAAMLAADLALHLPPQFEPDAASHRERVENATDWCRKIGCCGDENGKLRAENERLRAECLALRRNFARHLAPSYRGDCTTIAALCDEEIDQSGALLGLVREEALKIGA